MYFEIQGSRDQVLQIKIVFGKTLKTKFSKFRLFLFDFILHG